MMSSSPSHVIGVASSSPPRQLSVTDLFTYQRPRQSQPGLPSVTTTLPDQHRPAINMVKADHVTLNYRPELEIKDADQRRARRPPASSSFDDSAIENQSAPSTSSGGSRGHNGESRINQSWLSSSSAGTRCHNGSNGGASGEHLTRAVQRSPGDVTPKLMTSQYSVAAVRQAKRSLDPATLTRDSRSRQDYCLSDINQL